MNTDDDLDAELDPEDDDGLWHQEALQQHRMAFGCVDAIDDPPEPCGHHCGSDCPRCGEDWNGEE